MPWFQVVQPGTASYTAGGFKIPVRDYEKIVSAAIFMTPETLVATTKNVGLILTYVANTAMVKVCQRGDVALWNEVVNGTDLSGANFILTGKAI